GVDVGLVERIEDDQQQRHVQEQEHECARRAEDPFLRARTAHRFSSAPVRLVMVRNTTRVTSVSEASAAPNGKSSATPKRSLIAPPSTCEPPPTSCGATKSPIVSEKTKIEPATIPGKASGKITLRKVVSAFAPRSREASRYESGIFSRAV